MPYLVIDANRAIVSGGIVATQTAADTLAATDSAWTAHQGDVTGTDFHANAEPGWFLTTAGVTVGELPFTSLQELKNALWRAHDYLIATWNALHAESASHPWAEVTTVHDYYARIHPSNYRIVKENPNSLSDADLLRYAENLLDGPLKNGTTIKATIPELFAEIVTALPLPGALGPQGVTYVDPAAGTVLSAVGSLVEADRKSAGLGKLPTDPTGYELDVTDIQLASGDWINDLT